MLLTILSELYSVSTEPIAMYTKCGGDKSRQSKDIQEAKVYWQEYLNHEQL
jgi:putative component of toxin-antitoxin plasmid stabilization module